LIGRRLSLKKEFAARWRRGVGDIDSERVVSMRGSASMTSR